MRKNAHIHLLLETPQLIRIKEMSKEQNVSINAFCISKIFEDPRLEKIEEKINKLLQKNGIK